MAIALQLLRLIVRSERSSIPNSERIYVIAADQYPSMKLEQNGKSRVSASEIFEFGIAGERFKLVAVIARWTIALTTDRMA